MNWDRIEGNWKQMKGRVKQAWGKITEDELDKIEGKRDRLEGIIQEKYGIAKDEAKKQLDEEGLLTSEAKQSLNLIQQMNYKFGSDFKMIIFY